MPAPSAIAAGLNSFDFACTPQICCRRRYKPHETIINHFHSCPYYYVTITSLADSDDGLKPLNSHRLAIAASNHAMGATGDVTAPSAQGGMAPNDNRDGLRSLRPRNHLKSSIVLSYRSSQTDRPVIFRF